MTRIEVACPKRGGKKQMNNVFLKLLLGFELELKLKFSQYRDIEEIRCVTNDKALDIKGL